MTTNQTVDKLNAMGLQGMAEALAEQRQQKDMAEMEFEERLAMLVERQWLWKENRAWARRIQYAGFRMSASLEEIDYRHKRGLKRDHIAQLQAAEWIRHAGHCLITGPTGIGKTFLACALGHQACRDGWRVLYFYAPKFFRQLRAAHADGSLSKLLKKIARAELLIIDDLGLVEASSRDYRDLLEILEDRHGRAATLVTSQFPVEQWHELIGEATIADALLDRLVHGAYRIALDGPSLRAPNAASSKNQEREGRSDG